MAAHEVVTIQAGEYANFVGSHWWNMQESSFCYTPDKSIPLDINHDVMFREGLNLQREVTYTPRLVLVDLKTNLLSIRKECPLYRYPEEDKSEPLWDGTVDVIKDPPVRKNPFLEEFEKSSNSSENSKTSSAAENEVSCESLYNFDSSTTVWSDFLKTNLHPKSFCLLNEVCPSELQKRAVSYTKASENIPLQVYSSGEETYSKFGKDMIEDAVRRMTEECDYLQGFHVIFDAYNGFSGISSNILQYLDDEYHARPSICFPVFEDKNTFPVQDVKQQMRRLFAILLSLDKMNSYSSLFSPLSFSDDVVELTEPYRTFPFIQYDVKLQYHTSAIIAAAIETLTSPYRLKSLKFSMSEISSGMSAYGRKLVCSSLCLPFPLCDDGFISTMVEKNVPEYYMTSLTPFYKPDSEKTLFQSSVLRGVPLTRFQKPGKSLHHSVAPEELFGQYLDKYSASSVTTPTVFYEKCSVVPPFPKIFSSAVGISGLHPGVLSNSQGVEKVPVAASFSSADSSAEFIDGLLFQAKKLRLREYVKCVETACEDDDYFEVLHNLVSLTENYRYYY